MNALWRGVFALVLAASGQLLLNRYPPVGRSVDLYTVLVIHYAVKRRRIGVLVVGTSAGLLEDLLTHTFLGMNAFKKTLVGYLVGGLGSLFMLSQPLPRFAVLFVATLLEAFTEAGLILVLGGHPVLPSVGDLVREGIGNGISGTLIYWVAAKLE